MSYARKRPDSATDEWAALAEWTGGLPPAQIQALAVRPLEAVHALLRGLAGRNPRELLARATVLEGLASQAGSESGLGTGLDEAFSWLTEPARGDTLRALRRSGWLETEPAGQKGTATLTALGRQVWGALRRAVFPEAGSALLLPTGITPEQVLRALLTRSPEELAAAGRKALVPVLPVPPLLTTEGVARTAEAQALAGEDRLGHRSGGGQRP